MLIQTLRLEFCMLLAWLRVALVGPAMHVLHLFGCLLSTGSL